MSEKSIFSRKRIGASSAPDFKPPLAAPTPVGANKRVFVVGKSPNLKDTLLDQRLAALSGIPCDFETIAAAMDEIPLDPHGESWTILLTPGVYEEEVRMKPNVNLVGFGYHTVIIRPPSKGNRYAVPNDPRRATIYMNFGCSLSNLVIIKPVSGRSTDYCIWNKDTYKLGVLAFAGKVYSAPSLFSVDHVDIFPEPYAKNTKGKALLLEGVWGTILFNTFLSSYCETSGFDIDISGHREVQDCHFTNCFFDAFYLESEQGGCVSVSTALDVHLRTSLIRTGASPKWVDDNPGAPHPGAGVAVKDGAFVYLESTSLQGPGHASRGLLRVEEGSRCALYNSSADSYEGEPSGIEVPAIPNPSMWPGGASTIVHVNHGLKLPFLP